MRHLALVSLILLPASLSAQTKIQVSEITPFHVRARVMRIQGHLPEKKTFGFQFASTKKVARTTGAEWSEWLAFSKEDAEAALKQYPNTYLKRLPLVVRLTIQGVVDPTRVQIEVKFGDSKDAAAFEAEMFGPTLGLLIWKDGEQPRADTMASYNRRYWKHLEKVVVPKEMRPKHFPIVDRFIGGDNDRLAWRQGIDNLNKAGFSAIMVPPGKVYRDMLLSNGVQRTAWAVYSPPGYSHVFGKPAPDWLDDWAGKQAKPYLESGYKPQDMAMFTMSDEPGWYFPRCIETMMASPPMMDRFRQHLKAQKLEPADLGCKSWDEIKPLGRSHSKDLAERRLFYWTTRFFAYESSEHFANCTKALGKAFYPGMPVVTNWNFFAGRLYVPGAVANNPSKQHVDAAMGGHDWLEFGRLRGGTMLWTEDWFGDGRAYQWSFYCARLRSAARLGNVEFGGYIVPRTAGDREDGLVQRALSIIGHGGKAIKYFVFGPEYNFPGNCYSERARLLPKMAEAHQLIGAAEELLWAGRPPRSEVAILAPRSALMWDARDQPIAKGINDATNTNLNGATVDYMAEVFDLYLALQHANVPVDFVDEDDLTPAKLKGIKTLYVTAPNVPIEGQKGLAEWVKQGGTLVTVSGAAQADRYDEPADLLARELGIRETPRPRMLVASTAGLKVLAQGKGRHGSLNAVGVRGKIEADKADVLGEFADGSPAVVLRTVGKGRSLHFAFMPGLGYFKSGSALKDKLPVGFSQDQRTWILAGVELARAARPVRMDRPMIEGPVLLSDKGAAVTLLNWSGEPVEKLTVTIQLPFVPASVHSVRHGKCEFRRSGQDLIVTLPLTSADILQIRP